MKELCYVSSHNIIAPAVDKPTPRKQRRLLLSQHHEIQCHEHASGNRDTSREEVLEFTREQCLRLEDGISGLQIRQHTEC